MAKDFYEILNIERSASDADIKKAYKILCRKYHPDFEPNAPISKFLDIQEAFKILSHPQKRRHYDYYLDSLEQKKKPEDVSVHKKASLFSDFFHFAPSLEEIYDAFMTGYKERKSGSVKDIHVEITLTKNEARLGGTLSLEVPVPIPCRNCDSSGKQISVICPTCNGKGFIEKKRKILITHPPNTKDGSVFEYNLEEFHIPGLRLHVHFRII